MQRFPAFLLLCISLLLLLLAGCSNDPPSAVGKGLVLRSGKDSLKVTGKTFLAISDSTVLNRITGNSIYLLLGKAEGVESRMLLRFSTVNGDTSSTGIESAVLYLRPVYLFKDTIGRLAFSIHLANSTVWDPKTFLWDSSNAPGFVNDTIAGRFNHTISASDTQIAIHLDTSIVRRWVAAGVGSMILMPSDSSNILGGFFNNSLYSVVPRCVITYHSSTDTLPHTYEATAATFVANAPPFSIPAGASRFYTQSAVARRGIVKFNVSAIERGATISSAILEVTIDPTLSTFTTPRRDTMLAHLNLASAGDSLGYGVLNMTTDSTQRVISFQVNTIVQKWVNHMYSSNGFANNGFVLRNYSEFSGGERIAFYGAHADSLHRPRLHIIYTLVP